MSTVPVKGPKGQQRSPFPHICSNSPTGIQLGSSMCSACNWELGYIAAIDDARRMEADL